MRVEPQLKSAYVVDGTVQLRFHHLLDHGRGSINAAMAAECAGSQSPAAFWHMHDYLMARTSQLYSARQSDFVEFAGALDLDQSAFQTCMEEAPYLDKIQEMEQQRRSEWRVNRRPSFLINGRLYAGSIPFSAFEKAIADALAP